MRVILPIRSMPMPGTCSRTARKTTSPRFVPFLDRRRPLELMAVVVPRIAPDTINRRHRSCSDPDQHDENHGQGVEYYRVAFNSGHSGAGSNQLMEPVPGTSSLRPAATANDE